MKLDERYYCFGCGATGDAVDLTAKLFGIGLREAAVSYTHLSIMIMHLILSQRCPVSFAITCFVVL